MKDEFLVKYDMFTWKGHSKTGQTMAGKMRAESIEKATISLESKGVAISELKKIPTLLIPAKIQKKIKNQDIMFFFRQLSTMISAGIPLVQALEFVANGVEKIKFCSLIMSLNRKVSSGSSLADAMSLYPKYFPALVRSLIRVGEQSGTLDTVLDKIAAYLEHNVMLKGRVKKAMFYPVLIFGVMLVLSILLLVFIVPKFQGMFASFGADLPGPTQAVIDLSNTIVKYWWLFTLVIAVVVIAIYYWYKNSPKFRYFCARASLRVFLFGNLIKKTCLARVFQSLSITLSAGVPLTSGLESVAKVSGNLLYTQAIEDIKQHVSAGEQMSEVMSLYPKLFPPLASQMIYIGEKSGSIESMLKKISDYYTEEVNTMVEALSTLIEPLMIIMLGLLIGGFVISMYLPIFKIGTLV